MNEFENMYRKMLSQPFDDNQIIHNSFNNVMDDEETESFFDSEDIAKAEEKKAEVGGRNGVNPDIEESLVSSHFKRYTKRHEHKYTEQEMEEIRKGCETTIVHDYSEHDEYHMSDEERSERDLLKELAVELGSLRKTYRQVNQYIRAMRIVVKAWELLERKENFLHSKEEFFKMVGDGRIYSNRIIMPVFTRMKNYDIDVIIKYISNPELNPDDLMPQVNEQSQYDDWYSDPEEEEAEMERLLTEEEVQYIIDHEDHPEMMYVEPIKEKFLKNYDQSGTRKYKNMSKKDRFQAESLHTLLNKIQSTPGMRLNNDGFGRYSLLTNSMFELEEEKDDFWDNLRYHGSWTDKNGVKLHELAVNEALMNLPSGIGYQTYGDLSITNFFKTMEQKGMNVVKLRQMMNMQTSNTTKANTDKSYKEMKKVEARIIQRIEKVNNNPKFKKLIEKTERQMSEGLSEED